MLQTDLLRAAIDDLYRTFSSYLLRERIDACGHCHDSEDDRLIRSKELRELGVEELHRYIGDAIDLWGDEYDLRHFLPRILELCALDERLTDEFVDAPVLFAKFRLGNWGGWPIEEQEAVRRFLFALWESKLEREFQWDERPWSVVGEWLCAIGHAENDLTPYLEIWEAAGSSAAVGNLAHFIVSVEKELKEGTQWDPFWSDREAQFSQVLSWLVGTTVRQKLITSSTSHLSPACLAWVKRARATMELLA